MGPPGRTRRTKRIAVLAAAVIGAAAAGNSLLRVGLIDAPVTGFSPLAYLKEFANAPVILGVMILALGFVLQLILLSWADLTYVIPVTSASYGVIAVVGVVSLHEHVSGYHWIGIALILSGVVIVGRTKPLTTGTRE